jgi:3D (Asp-Asp-Asp) domain-containing protein
MNRKESVSLAMLVLFALGSFSARAADDPLGKFRNTYYYMIFESDYPKGKRDTEILTMDGTVLAKVTAAFMKDLMIEGSAKLRDGRTVNWAGRVDGKSRYHITKLPWGRGTGACALSPFRTIAADPTQIPSGAVVKIAETVGMKLPDGTVSDGVWRAEDTGSAILHDRIDLFIGRRSDAHLLEEAGIPNMKALTISLVAHPLPDSCVFKNPE